MDVCYIWTQKLSRNKIFKVDKIGIISPILISGTNPTTLSYNASAVNLYSAANSMARFQNKNYFSPT
jgi:hypothetical protein